MPRRATVKVAKVPLGADGEDIAGMFNSMLGEGRLDMAVAYPKYCALREYMSNIHSIFTELIGAPFFANYPDFSAERKEIETFLVNLNHDIGQAFEFNFDREIFELDKLPEETREAFSNTYRAIKTADFVNEMIRMGDNLADYRDRIEAADINFVDNIPGAEWRPFPFTALNLKDVFAAICLSPNRATIAGLFLTVMKSTFENCYKIYKNVSQPDIDIEKFIAVLMEAISKLKKLPKLSRCGRAFDKIAESVDIFRTKFGQYYSAFVQTKSSTIILENFVLDVAHKSDADIETMRQFKLIVNYYREQAAASGKMSPDVAKLFNVMETNMSKFSEMAGKMNGMDEEPMPQDIPDMPAAQPSPQQRAEMLARERAAAKSVEELAAEIEGKGKSRRKRK
jgi:hypothetical protein